MLFTCNFFQEMGMGRRREGSFQNKKQIKYFQLPQKKNQTVSSRKLPIFLKTLKQVTTRSRRQGITMGKHKTKAIQAIQAYSCKFQHVQAYSDIIMHIAYLGIIPGYSGIWRTLYSPCIFRTLAYSEGEPYLEPCQRSTMEPFA